ncbi:MAG: DHH family phosphoesterase [Clostridiales bacterium]|nr:DHH family phosphoesterase [Clostridiales bacterium]
MDRWVVINKKADFKGIGSRFGIDQVTARIIRNRDVVGDEAVEEFLHGGQEFLHDPRKMKDAIRLVEILRRKINEQKHIRIIGDYDIDGVMSTYILYTALSQYAGKQESEKSRKSSAAAMTAADINAASRSKGCDKDSAETAASDCGMISARIPDRIKDGYGLNRHLIDEAYADGVDTILTCDNGIAAIDEINYAVELGMTVLVTDHHEPPYMMDGEEKVYLVSRAEAVVNPHQHDCKYPYKDLCGAGVAFKIICLLYQAEDEVMTARTIPREAEQFLEFVAFATVGDIMSLTGENRILVKEGLKRIHQTTHVGMRALIARCGLEPANIDAYHFGFVLGPCINATGRLDTAKRAFMLFCETDRKKAEQMAEELVVLNEERKQLTERGVQEAIRLCEGGVQEKEKKHEAEPENSADKATAHDYMADPVLVLYLPDVHESIAGIIAGRIRDRYYKPTFVLTRAEDGVKGSGRSVEEYSMYERMCECRECFTKFGGHPMAAGLSLPEENVEVFREKINALCPQQCRDLSAKIKIDVPMPLSYVTAPLVREFSLLAPFGKANPRPIFADRNLKIRRMRKVGANQNVMQITLVTEDGFEAAGVYFHEIPRLEDYLVERFGREAVDAAYAGRANPIVIAAVYYPRINTYMGRESVQYELQAIR